MAIQPGYHKQCIPCFNRTFCFTGRPLQYCVVCRCIVPTTVRCALLDERFANLCHVAEFKFLRHLDYVAYSLGIGAALKFFPHVVLTSVQLGGCVSCNYAWQREFDFEAGLREYYVT